MGLDYGQEFSMLLLNKTGESFSSSQLETCKNIVDRTWVKIPRKARNAKTMMVR